MIKAFQDYIIQKSLINKEDKVLLAVSGGADSMAMLDLFLKSGYDFAIAHCNFNLRAEESDGDEALVAEIAEKKGVKLFVKKFDTIDYAEKNKISIEMAARELRYNWFNQIMLKEHYSLLATAHHQDDIVETALLNLCRGTGIAGLHGIKVKNNNIIRPMLFASRNDIMDYIKTYNLQYRDDSTNSDTKYRRNKIRHEIIPMFESMNPSFRNSVIDTTQRLSETEQIADMWIEDFMKKSVIKKGDAVMLNIYRLKQCPALHACLFKVLSKYGFSGDIITDIASALDNQAGKMFYSNEYIILKDRDFLIINKRKPSVTESFEIEDKASSIEHPIFLSLNFVDDFKINDLTTSNLTAFLSADMLKYPLTLRRWKPGDYFYPLGLNKKKKISNFFTDIKLPRTEKDNVWLLCSGEHIVWVVGHRIDNRFKVTENAKRVLIINYEDKINKR